VQRSQAEKLSPAPGIARALIRAPNLAARSSASRDRPAASSASHAINSAWISSAGGAAVEVMISFAILSASSVAPLRAASFASSVRIDHSYQRLV
jgi:hypothetical protein